MQFGFSLQRVARDFDPATDMHQLSDSSKFVFTDDGGRFEIRGLLPGRYVVARVRRSGVPIVFEVTEDAGQTVELRAR